MQIHEFVHTRRKEFVDLGNGLFDGSGSGSGSGCGSGFGYGYGCGYGDGDGEGSNSAYGHDIKRIRL